MQAHQFKDGSYVAHRVYVNANVSTMKHSVWFSKDGELTDCIAYDKLHRERPVTERVKKVLSTMFGHVVAYSKV